MLSSYTDLPGMRGLAASGAYGDMPSDLLIRKMQNSTMPENPSNFEQHMRSLLADFSPDPISLASDAPHDPHSAERLSLRYSGARTDADPYLPDGTFLDYEFMERDPRSQMLTPDMRQHVKQQVARASLIKFYNDDDYSVPESGIAPAKMVKNIRSTQNSFKNRYTNFEESYNGMDNTKRIAKITHNIIDNVIDTPLLSITDAVYQNRPDAVSQLSSDPTIAFRHSTPDHRVKISQYGQVRSNVSPLILDWKKNRNNSNVDHARMAMLEGELVNKTLANLIIDLAGQRANKMESNKGSNYGDADITRNKAAVIPAKDIVAIMQLSIGSSVPNANTILTDGKHIIRYGAKPKNDCRVAAGHVQINHEMLESMIKANKKVASKKLVQEIRDKVQQTMYDQGIYYESMNKKAGKQALTANRTRTTDYDRTIEDSKAIANYSTVEPKRVNKMELLAVDQYGDESQNSQQRNRQITKDNTNVNMHSYDTNQQEQFGVFDRADRIDPIKTKNKGRSSQFGLDASDLTDDYLVNDL